MSFGDDIGAGFLGFSQAYDAGMNRQRQQNGMLRQDHQRRLNLALGFQQSAQAMQSMAEQIKLFEEKTGVKLGIEPPNFRAPYSGAPEDTQGLLAHWGLHYE